MSKTREHVSRGATAPNTAASRVHPGLRPYPALRFLPEPELHERAARFTQSLLRRLRIWRVEQRLTREELAELTEIPPSAIKRAERTGRVSVERFVILAFQLGLEDDLCDLFAYRRNCVPALVLAARTAQRKNGRRAERERARRRGRA